MMDMGSANTSGLFANLARRLQVKLIAHAPGNARATGMVEKARDIIERSFESSLRLAPVQDLAELNAQAQRWARWYNANKVHSRHGKTRFDQWLTIAPDQLRIAPDEAFCRILLTHTPESRKVNDTLTVSFKGAEYDVRDIPGVMVGEKLSVTFNAYSSDSAVIVELDAEGNELLHTVPKVQRDEAGFRTDANVIGEDWKRHADTQADANRKEVGRFAYEAANQDEVDAKIKAKATPFGGRIDPFKVIDQAPERTFLPKRGTALPTGTKTVAIAARTLSRFEAAAELVRMGMQMNRERNLQIAQWYPDGVPEDELTALQSRLTSRPVLKVVGVDA